MCDQNRIARFDSIAGTAPMIAALVTAAGSFAVDREGRVRAEPGWTEIEAAEAMVHLVLVSRGIDGAGGKADGNDVVACEAVGLLRPEALEACVVLGRKLAPRYVSAVRRSFEACTAY